MNKKLQEIKIILMSSWEPQQTTFTCTQHTYIHVCTMPKASVMKLQKFTKISVAHSVIL